MCGILGYMTLTDIAFEAAKDKFFTEGTFVNTLRGADSTGYMAVSEEFHWEWAKHTVSGSKFVQTKDFRERTVRSWCGVAHNRSATVGKIEVDNAHPFHHDTILLVHNGTLRNTTVLPYSKPGLQVDSDKIAFNLSQVEPDDAYKIIEKLCGAFALVWFDTRDKSINMVRNSERPFHMGLNRAGTLLYFASDGHMLRFVAQRSWAHDARPHKIWQLGTHNILKYKKGSLVPQVRQITPFTFAAPIRGSGSSSSTAGFIHDSNTQWDEEDWAGTWADQRGHGRSKTHTVTKIPYKTQVTVNGEQIPVPESHKTMLEDWYSTKLTDDMCFQPKRYIPWGNSGLGALYGKVYHEAWNIYFDAVVHNVTQYQKDTYGTSPWTVKPIGIDHSGLEVPGPGSACTIIASVKWFSWQGPVPVVAAENKEDTAQAIADEDTTDLLRGPHNHLISEESFIKLCEDGCTMCSAPLEMTDHWEIEWIGEMGNQPICHSCIGYGMLQETT